MPNGKPGDHLDSEDDALLPPLDIRFEGCAEIRMGSPFRACTLRLQGDWVPDLPADWNWQEIVARSPDGALVGLGRFLTTNNEPGFQVVTIDRRARAVTTSNRIAGICRGLSLSAVSSSRHLTDRLRGVGW
jgi:hypothetical protein